MPAVADPYSFHTNFPFPLCTLQVDAAVADLLAVRDRDPACDKYTQCLLNFKGYQAIQCHRVSHWLWNQGRKVRVVLLVHPRFGLHFQPI